MATQRCSNCGAFGPPGTAFCAFCGTPFTGGAGAAPTSGGPTSHPFGPPAATPWSPGAAGVSAESTLRDQRALTYVVWAAAVVLLSGAISIAFGIFSGYSGSSLQLTPSFIGLTVSAGLCELVSVLLLWIAFRQLAPIDPRFSVPHKLSLVLAVAIASLLAVFDPLISATNTVQKCLSTAGSNSTAIDACATQGHFVVLILVTLLISILALVGIIGLLLGVWRLGSRYASSYFKIGAILLIIPVANLFGGLLILVAARAARERPGTPAPPTTPPI